MTTAVSRRHLCDVPLEMTFSHGAIPVCTCMRITLASCRRRYFQCCGAVNSSQQQPRAAARKRRTMARWSRRARSAGRAADACALPCAALRR